MQKKIIALAVAGMVSGVAFAQSNVTIYGILDTGLYNVQSKGVSTSTGNFVGNTQSANGSGYLNGSRLGFKGTEALGNGLNAGFLLEYGINMTTDGNAGGANGSGSSVGNAAPMANMRQGYVSLGGDTIGTIKIGTQYSFIDPASGTAGSTMAYSTGGTNASQGAANMLKNLGEAAIARTTNAIVYESPTWSGVSFRLGWNPSETVSDVATSGGKKEAMNEATIQYKNGPIAAGYVIENVYKYQNSNGTAGATTGKLIDFIGTSNDFTFGSVSAGLSDLRYQVYGGTYDFGVAKVGLHESRMQNIRVDGSGDVKSRIDALSVGVPVGARVHLDAGYAFGKITQSGSDAFAPKAFDLMALYDFSKRTNVYVVWSETKYDSKISAQNTIKQDQYGIGIRHNF